MENKKLLILGGGATACIALGYLGLHYMGGEFLSDDISEEVSEEINEKKMYNPVDKEEVKEGKEKEEEEGKEEGKEEDKKESGWGNFWRTTYENENYKIETTNKKVN